VELKRQHTEEALRESTEQLRSSEERFSKAFRSSPSLMSITRMSDGRLIDINEAFLRSLRKTREETVGKTTIELGLWESEEERCAFLEALRTHGVVRNRERRFLIDGQPRIFLHSADVITLQDAPCLLTVAIDISARKKVEVELLKALDRERELSQLKSNFVATVSQERLFQAFHRGQNVGKIAGTGLGLVIVKRCVELHNGRIRFQSEEGRGTTFQVRLPLFPVEVNGVSNAGDSTWFFRKNEVGHIEL
jgi:PAS domain S-box-containing protein